MDNTIISSKGKFGDGRELSSKNVQIRLMGHCIICLRKVSTRQMRTSTNYGSLPPTEIAPKSVVTAPGFLTTFNQVWAVLYAKWKEKNMRAKDDGSMEEIGISLENVIETGCASTNVSFSKAPTICQLCCLKVLAVENLMKAVRQQVREINMLLEEGRNRQDGGLGDFESNLREEGLEEHVIKATLQFVGIFGSSRCSEQKGDFQDLKEVEGSGETVVSMPNIMEMECDDENSLISSRIDGDDNIEFVTEGSGDEYDDRDPDYIKSEENIEEGDEDDESEDDMEDDDDDDDRNDPDYEAEMDPLASPLLKRKKGNSSSRKLKNEGGSRGTEEVDASQEVLCSCGKTFKNKKRLHAHMRDNKTLHPNYVSEYVLIREVKDANLDHSKFPCSCGKSFATMRRRRDHIRRNKELHPEYKLGVYIEGRRRPVCELCGERVVFSELLQHYTDHLNGKAEFVLKCPNEQCGLTFVTSKTFNRHVHRVKTDECSRIYREKFGPICDICGFKGTNTFKIINHVREKHEIGEKKLKCPISGCGKMFCVKQSVNEHLYEHRYRPISQQICDKCGKDLKIEEMEGHLKEEHGIEEVIGCGQCEMKFSGRDEMVEHLYEHRGILCDICGEDKFARYIDFREHYFGVHKLCPKKYKCGEEGCDNWFWRDKLREVHELRMHKESSIQALRYRQSKKEKKEFECDVCIVKFVTENGFISHQIKVHGADPFKCDICGETFNDKHKLNKHKKEHAGIVFQKEWRCVVEGCEKVFKDKKLLKRHKEVGHGAVKKHVCEICGKAYSDASGLRGHHDIVHLGLRSCVCDECGERFASSQILKRHKLIHTGERPFGCEICGQRFRHKEVLKTHVRGHEEKGADFKPNGPMKQIRKRKAQ